MRKVISNPAGIASRKNQRKDSKARPVSTMNRIAMEGTGSGNCRGQGIHIPNASAMPRDPASGAASARKASFGQGINKNGHLSAEKSSERRAKVIAPDGLLLTQCGRETALLASLLS